MKYKVRTNDGKIVMQTNDKRTADMFARQRNGYVKSSYDAVNPFYEES